MEGVLVLLFLALLVVFLVTRKAAIKAFSKSYELPPAQDIHEQKQEWQQLTRIRKAAEARRTQQVPPGYATHTVAMTVEVNLNS